VAKTRERDLYLNLFLAIVIMFFVGNYSSLTWVPAAVVWLVYILAVVVTLKRQDDEVD